jgi:hypothetical protein
MKEKLTKIIKGLTNLIDILAYIAMLGLFAVLLGRAVIYYFEGAYLEAITSSLMAIPVMLFIIFSLAVSYLREFYRRLGVLINILYKKL